MSPRLRVLVEATAVVLAVGCRAQGEATARSQGSAPPEDSKGSMQVAPDSSDAGALRYLKPMVDLPASRLSERVDGGEAKLRALGCTRLRVWHLADPPADLELYSFEAAQGARRRLVEQVGIDSLNDSIGEEAWLGTNALYFRRGKALVSIIADTAISPESLMGAGRSIDEALVKGEVLP